MAPSIMQYAINIYTQYNLVKLDLDLREQPQ